MGSKGNMTNCCYYLMYVFTFLFLLCGCAVLGVALYLRFNLDSRTIFDSLAPYYKSNEGPVYEKYPEVADAVGSQFYFYFCYALMLIGGLIMFVGFIGCCGTIYESSCILCFFSFLLLLLMILQVGTAGFGYWQIKETPDEDNVLRSWVAADMQYLVRNYNDERYGQAMDAIQQRLKCCGANSAQDYSKIPASCSDTYNNNNQFATINHYDEGCTFAFMNFLEERIIAGMTVLFCVGIFEFIGILFACCLCCGIRGQNDYSTA